MNEPLPQSGGSYILTEAGELVRADEAPAPAPFETLSETESEEAGDGR